MSRRLRSLAAVAITTCVLMAVPGLSAPTATAADGGAVPVLVILKKQPGDALTPSARADVIGRAQRPVMRALQRARARKVTRSTLVGVVFATVPVREAAGLAASAGVAAVVPDRVIRLAPPAGPASRPAAPSASVPRGATRDACPPPGRTMLEPEALALTKTASDDPGAATAHGLGITGKGVKVGYIADGVDTAHPDLRRSDGSAVVTDYQDFTGEGPDAATGGGQGFLDASAIAAQGHQVYDVGHFGSGPWAQRCDVRITGVAPDARLIAMKAFGGAHETTTSKLVQSIEYAVRIAGVDVLNESFGYRSFPDTDTQDVIRMFNDAATGLGTTVVVAAGDAGGAAGVASPADDPQVVSVGASTAFRGYAQTGYEAAGPALAPRGWLDDNVSALSAVGLSQRARTVDLVAPGDAGFALCTPDIRRFTQCADLAGRASPVVRGGGTGQAAPLTAGAAALVIQAYRQAHQGTSPSPAQVKQILTSTTDDLGAPPAEQGTGRLDAYRAVRAAGSTGSDVLVDQDQLGTLATAGSQARWRMTVTNPGAGARTVHLTGRQFGAPQGRQSGRVRLSDTGSRHFTDSARLRNNYGTVTFRVPEGADRLQASFTSPTGAQGRATAGVRLTLVDARGRYAARSAVQEAGGRGTVDVVRPAPGRWTAVISSPESCAGGTTGTVRLTTSTSRALSFGSVSPSVLTLAPGATGTVTVAERLPSAAGDVGGAVVLDTGTGARISVPVVARALVDIGHQGRFAGALTAQDRGPGDTGQDNVFQFDVPEGRQSLQADIALGDEPGDVMALLVDPHGRTTAYGSDRPATSYDPRTGTANLAPPGPALTLSTGAPAAGRWALVVRGTGPATGDRPDRPFHGTVRLDTLDIHAVGLPQGSAVPAGRPISAALRVRNTGAAPQSLFVDPRLDTKGRLALSPLQPAESVALPQSAGAPSPAWLVPTRTSAVQAQAVSDRTVMFDLGSVTGDPQVISTTGTTAQTGFAASAVTAGMWAAGLTQTGPFGPQGAPPGTATMTMTVSTRLFDTTVTSATDDLWQQSVRPAHRLRVLTVRPGESLDIPVTITPAGAAGTVVRGTAYLDSLVVGDAATWSSHRFSVTRPALATGNELAGFSYEYRIA